MHVVHDQLLVPYTQHRAFGSNSLRPVPEVGRLKFQIGEEGLRGEGFVLGQFQHSKDKRTSENLAHNNVSDLQIFNREKGGQSTTSYLCKC